MRIRSVMAFGLCVAVTLCACGDDGAAARKRYMELSSYCETAASLNAALTGMNGPEVPAGSQIAAESAKRALSSMGSGLDAWQESAPEGLNDETKLVVEALRAAANGDLSKANDPQYDRAQKTLAEFGASECPQGSSSGDL